MPIHRARPSQTQLHNPRHTRQEKPKPQATTHAVRGPTQRPQPKPHTDQTQGPKPHHKPGTSPRRAVYKPSPRETPREERPQTSQAPTPPPRRIANATQQERRNTAHRHPATRHPSHAARSPHQSAPTEKPHQPHTTTQPQPSHNETPRHAFSRPNAQTPPSATRPRTLQAESRQAKPHDTSPAARPTKHRAARANNQTNKPQRAQPYPERPKTEAPTATNDKPGQPQGQRNAAPSHPTTQQTGHHARDPTQSAPTSRPAPLKLVSFLRYISRTRARRAQPRKKETT
jgi:hypothetical protein